MDVIELKWASVDSKYEVLNLGKCGELRTELLTEDPNRWGFFRFQNGNIIVIGYANLGLPPMWVAMRNSVLIGIDEVLACIDISTLEVRFRYTMPSVFHEFVSVDKSIIVRDEIGFVGLSLEGGETWKFLVDGPVDEFHIKDKIVYGRKIDGDLFNFSIP